jgi:cytochrome c553
MQHHFVDIGRVHEAVIRGDLPGVHASAAALATMPVPNEPPVDPRLFVGTIRQAGRLASTASNLRTAAASTVTMLRQCADCHRAAGVYPTPRTLRRPDVGGIVGHMLDHQRAADELLEGLVIPSDAMWLAGVERLRTAALHPSDWPRDRALTPEVRAAERTVHALVDRGRAATSSNARAAVYADLITTCASCHSLHPGIWGPRSR